MCWREYTFAPELGLPIMPEKSTTDTDEWRHEIEAQQMSFDHLPSRPLQYSPLMRVSDATEGNE